MALMTPNASAKASPNIQLKYHITYSSPLVKPGVTAYRLERNPAAQHVINPRRVGKHDGKKDYDRHQHDEQRFGAARCVPNREAVIWIRGRGHQEREQRNAG